MKILLWILLGAGVLCLILGLVFKFMGNPSHDVLTMAGIVLGAASGVVYFFFMKKEDRS